MEHTLALKADGSLYAWGNNESGQLGDGTYTNRNIPTLISTGWSGATIAAGGFHTIVLKTDGTLYAWGYNGIGQLGDGTYTNRNTPTFIGTGWSGAIIAAGGGHTIALKTDGTLWAWGWNGYGQLGDGTTITRTVPTLIGTGWSGATIAAGERHTVAVKTNGTLWAWGYNWTSQLGDGTIIDRLTPTFIGTGWSGAAIVAGGHHTVAVKANGTLWAWGYNMSGQLGNGTTSYSESSPTQIGSGSTWSAIAAGWRHTVALKTDGTLWAWGYNGDGQLGDGTTATSQSSPVQITGTAWAQVACKQHHTLSIKTDGTLWAWGYNYNGQLGDGTNIAKDSPVQIFGTPYQAASPTPADGAANIPNTQQLRWASANGADSYDIYFGTTNPPNSVGNQAGTTYNPGILADITPYYWRIDSKNSSGVTAGTVWSFTTALSTTGTANWTIRSSANKPAPRYSYAQAYDFKRDKTVLFGGNTGNGWSDETWEWDGTNWTLLTPANKPTGRGENVMVYDSARERMVMFGGLGTVEPGNGTNDQTWEWDGTNWTLMTTAVTPTDRCGYAMAYDATRGKTIMFGGTGVVTNVYTIADTTYTIINLSASPGTWKWDGTNWTLLTPSNNPSWRYNATMARSPNTGNLILFGGIVDPNVSNDETWEWDGTNWTQKSPVTKPPIRNIHSMAYDSTRNKTILFGGRDGTLYYNDLWEWNGTDWTAINTPGGPSPHAVSSMVYHSFSQKVFIFGGSRYSDYNFAYYDDIWEYNY